MRLFLLLLLAALAGCTSTYAYRVDLADADRRQQVTERAARQDVTVRVQGETGVPARALSVRADSATWTDPATGAARTVATHRLSAVTFPGSSASPLRALALGAGGGALAGAAVGALVYDLPHGPIDSHGDAAAFGAAGTGLLGGLIAGWVASDRRKDDLFLFSPQPDAPLADAAGGAASGPARRP